LMGGRRLGPTNAVAQHRAQVSRKFSRNVPLPRDEGRGYTPAPGACFWYHRLHLIRHRRFSGAFPLVSR